MNDITRSPLCWPDNVTRTAAYNRGTPRFGKRSLYDSSRFVSHEVNRLNGKTWSYSDTSLIISSNLRLKQDGTPYSQQPPIIDPGIAVYFTLRVLRNGKCIEKPVVLTCDKWKDASDNLYAIGKDIEAQRARERWGCTNYEQSFRGYLAIPERCGGKAWWDILKVTSNSRADEIESAFSALSKQLHPDMPGGSHEAFCTLRRAYEEAMNQAR